MKDISDTKTQNSFEKKRSRAGFILLLICLFLAAVYIRRTATSTGIIMIGDSTIPIASFAGMFSMLTNICLIFLVVFYDKPGLITAVVFLAVNFPILMMGIIMDHSFSSIPGLFGGLFTLIAAFLIYSSNKKIRKYQETELDNLREKQLISQRLFEQTATALVNAIDAKDTYSHGHSLRVAEYSEKIADMLGKSEEERTRIYYAALLHDVGKIGIDESIINKPGKLTPEEYAVIKQHPNMGSQILSGIKEYPYLSIGAHYHHERYDGKGYPDRLKGDDIPEIARIISVADAYDAMSSNRSYRKAIPQQLVREEIIKGAGTQFDPEIARIMRHLIDMDPDYTMKERAAVKELSGKHELRCKEFRSEISDGIAVTSRITKIHLLFTPGDKKAFPALILFDSLDERVHKNEKTRIDLNYFEYCELYFDGHIADSCIRKARTETVGSGSARQISASSIGTAYDIEAVKVKDHVLISIEDGEKTVKTTIALPDSSRYVYIGLSGENCLISNVNISRAEEPVDNNYIPRIAEEISYIDGPEGDIPNIQTDGYRYDATEGIPITDGLTLTFHTKSLPTSRLVWHCPYIDVFYSDDRKVYGEGYREYSLIRLDGEHWDEEVSAENKLYVNKSEDFKGWDAWKKSNKEGFECAVTFSRKGNEITVFTENLGLTIKNVITVTDGKKNIYAALTGDQCAITNIRINK